MKSTEPLVSIVIPCYNAEKTILRTLISVFKSYYENIEIIAINDGSTDSTLSILNSLKSHDPRLHIINQKIAAYQLREMSV